MLLAQDCYGWGYKSVQILLEKIVNNKNPDSERVIDPLTRVTKENADEYREELGEVAGEISQNPERRTHREA